MHIPQPFSRSSSSSGSFSSCSSSFSSGSFSFSSSSNSDFAISPRNIYTEDVVHTDGRLAINFLSYPKYYEADDGALYQSDDTILDSEDPDWDWEVTAGIWDVFIKRDGTYESTFEGEVLRNRLVGIGFFDNATKTYIPKIDIDVSTWLVVISGNSVRWSNNINDITYTVRYKYDRAVSIVSIPQPIKDWLIANAPAKDFNEFGEEVIPGRYLLCVRYDSDINFLEDQDTVQKIEYIIKTSASSGSSSESISSSSSSESKKSKKSSSESISSSSSSESIFASQSISSSSSSDKKKPKNNVGVNTVILMADEKPKKPKKPKKDKEHKITIGSPWVMHESLYNGEVLDDDESGENTSLKWRKRRTHKSIEGQYLETCHPDALYSSEGAIIFNDYYVFENGWLGYTGCSDTNIGFAEAFTGNEVSLTMKTQWSVGPDGTGVQDQRKILIKFDLSGELPATNIRLTQGILFLKCASFTGSYGSTATLKLKGLWKEWVLGQCGWTIFDAGDMLYWHETAALAEADFSNINSYNGYGYDTTAEYDLGTFTAGSYGQFEVPLWHLIRQYDQDK